MMHWFGFGWSGFLVMILIWGLLIAAAVALVKALFSWGSSSQGTRLSREEDSLEILKKRYARGEVSRDEYELIKGDLIES